MEQKLSSAVLMFLLFATSMYVSQGVEVDAICKKASNPSFCRNIVNSKPGGAANADLVGIAQYVVDVTRVNVTNTIKLIHRLIRRNVNNSDAREHYTLCLKHFNYETGALRRVELT
ncbi:pectinesterase inhibitor 1-like [Abrus precatorius]|uniref:Pectinesterase inhibitor 1-like n=1 Tax=Abrus precatorius TaxID=3816 RepID=A0A8B8LP59_ABRPR|nr:pectinesterase inhibitor 1-like [Abrus precatorius]